MIFWGEGNFLDVVLRKMQCTVETKVAVVFELVVSLFILCSSRDFCRKSFLLPYADLNMRNSL